MNATKMTLSDLYAIDGLPWTLITLTTVRTLISTIGFIFNMSLVYVTAKSKSLNSPCNLLIAFDAAACAWFELGSWVGMAQILSRHEFMPIHLCCLYLLLPFICGFYASVSANLLIALDRMLSICCPIWYATRKTSRLYTFGLMLLCCSLFPGFILQLIIRLMLDTPEQNTVMCAPHECIWGWAGKQNYALNSIVTGTTVGTYVFIWVLLLLRKRNTAQIATSSSADAWTRRILKALAFLMALQLAGQTVSSAARLALPSFQLTITSSAVTTFLLSCLTNIVMASNAPVLYKMNTEYRQAYQKVFKFIPSSNKVTSNAPQQQWAHRVTTDARKNSNLPL